MSTTSRAQIWLESLGDWSWPGQRAGHGGEEALEALPPSWVPAFPPRLQTFAPAGAGAGAGAAGGEWQSQRAIPRRRFGLGALLSAVAAVCAMLVLHGPLSLEPLAGVRTATPAAPTAAIDSLAPPAGGPPPVTLTPVSQDAAGSSIDSATYRSAALGDGGEGSFLVYLPAGYASTASRYPVLYMLTGNDQSNTAFLQVGLQSELDRLIARHAIPPLIAVLIQGGPGFEQLAQRGHGAL